MNAAGFQRLRQLADRLCADGREPLDEAERQRLLHELWNPPRRDDLFAPGKASNEESK